MKAPRRSVALAALAIAAAALPAPAALRGAGPWLDAPLDPALRVPFGAAFLRGAGGTLAPGDRVLELELPGDGRRVSPRSRAELVALLRAAPAGGGAAVLRVARGRGVAAAELRLSAEPAVARLARDATVPATGALFLLFALAVASASRHPVARPLAALSLCAAAILLAQLDLLLPEDAGLAGLPGLRARLGLVAVALAPACVLHLAMRFPVVAPSLRTPAAAVLPYAVWLPAAASAALRAHDAAFLVALERIALGAVFAAAAILVAASVTAARRMTSIERARTAALVVGLSAAGAVPLAVLFTGRAPAPALRAPACLALLALPAAVAWPILRYRLLRLPSAAARPRAFERFLDAATRALSGAAPAGEVVARAAALVAAHLGASRVEFVALGPAARAPGALGAAGLALWRARAAPARVLCAGARTEDPAPELPEAVVPLAPRCGARGLLVVASRADGLPYGADHERMLESLRCLADTALDAAATTGELAARVAEQTALLERAVADRERVLLAARGICEAAAPEEIRARVAEFCAGAEAGGGPCSARRRELLPQVEVLETFAGLALARLALLSELKREVEHQAAELAEIRSRRLHAEFVRGVAHELRKPVEEVRRRGAALAAAGPDGRAAAQERFAAATRELSRRLDLLLFHSGLRLDRQRVDLVRIADDALEAARAACPDRRWKVSHARPRLPLIGDASRLLSVLENLLDNAAKATAPGGRIELRTGPRPGLEVTDDGAGIPPAELARIFEPGVSLVPGGFGLGLSLCREIVRRHGGRIEVDSRPGRTRFRVLLTPFHVPGEGDERAGFDPAG
jgi:two-component system OmpR family sensor kinase